MTFGVGKTAGLCLALLLAQDALALGLGEVSGQAFLGQPLRLEIPLLGSGSSAPAPHCFRLRPPVAELGNDFVPRYGRIQVVADRSGSKLLVTTTAPLREPFVGFAVAAGCGFELTKDYVVLAGLSGEAPAETPAPQAVTPPIATAAPQPPAAAIAATPAVKPPVVPPAADKTLRIEADTTLEALAQQKYPAQPKAREKFMRMMAQANPNAVADGGRVAAGTELQLPAGLPQRRIGPYLGEAQAAAPQPSARPEAAPVPQAPVPPRPVAAAKAPKAGKDRLVLGAGPEPSESKLLAEAERLTALLMEQNKTQEAMNETIARLERDYDELQKRYARVEQRVNQIEAERRAEKEAPKSASFDIVELLAAILGGGAVGGALLHAYQRVQRQRGESMESAEPGSGGMTIRLPWAKKPEPEPAPAEPPPAQVAAIVTTPAAVAAAIAAASAAPPTIEVAATPPAADDDRPHLVDLFSDAKERPPTDQSNLLDFHNN